MVEIKRLVSNYNLTPKRQEKHSILLDKAYKYVVEEGNYKNSFANIAEGMEVERRTLYRYFKNREILLAELYVVDLVWRKKQVYRKLNEINTTTKLSSIEKFYVMLEMHLDHLIELESEVNTTQFQKYVERNMVSSEINDEIKNYLNTEEPWYYSEVMTSLKADDYLVHSINGETYAKVVEQLIESYFYTINLKNKINDNYRFQNLKELVAIMKLTVLKKH